MTAPVRLTRTGFLFGYPVVTPHTLRHTCATWMLRDGRTLWEVAGHLGASALMIERTYGHHQPVEEPKRRSRG